MSAKLRAELAAIRAAMEREDRINACQHAEDDGRCLLCEADAEYMVQPQWVRDKPDIAGQLARVYREMAENSVQLDAESAAVLREHFWDLI